MRTLETVIVEELIANNMDTTGIAPRLGIRSSKVRNVRRKLLDHSHKTYPIKSDPTELHLGHRTQPYYKSEDEIGELPTYACTNPDLIKPIRKDWKLW